MQKMQSQNKNPANGWEDVSAPSQPEKRKIQPGPSAVSILPEAGSSGNRRGGEMLGAVLARVYLFVIAANEGSDGGQ
jgi:hypothetical protein